MSNENNLILENFKKYLKRANLKIGDNCFLFPTLKFDYKLRKVVMTEKILSYDKYRMIVKNAVEQLGLDSSFFITHSCRSGGASQLASQVSQCELMVNGRWRSTSSLGSYVEISDKVRFGGR